MMALNEDETVRNNWTKVLAVTMREWFRNSYNWVKSLYLSEKRPDASHVDKFTRETTPEWAPTLAECAWPR